MIESILVNDSDIDRIAKIMNRNFDDKEIREVLKEIDNCNIFACPGSGKTTTLVAKLAILSDKLPSNQGICVLSHTNAAREEIEKTLGKYSSKLLNYPNFVGTIQSFIDKYFAIPYYIKVFKRRPIGIDDDIYSRAVQKYAYMLGYAAKQYLGKKREGYIEFLKKVRYSVKDSSLCLFDNGIERELGFGKDTKTYMQVMDFKTKMVSLGYLCYYDAYHIAERYIEKYNDYTKLLTRRFPIVFIDEVQDTSDYQMNIINKVFKESTIQLIGDKNQSIYGDISIENESTWQNNNKVLTLSKSYRMSTSIANLCSKTAVIKFNDLQGNTLRKNCKNTIFLFNDESKDKVLESYCKLIEEMELKDGPFYAIGAVAKENEDPYKYSIGSYFSDYNKYIANTKKIKSYKGYFLEAQKYLTKSSKKYIAIREASEKIIEGILHILLIMNLKGENENNFSKNTLKKFLKKDVEDYIKFNRKILQWCKSLIDEEMDWDNICKDTIEILKSVAEIDLSNQEISEFMKSDETEEEIKRVETKSIYKYKSAIRDIEVKLDTIHAVKGQTHQATLLLETFNYDYNLKSILPYFIDEAPKNMTKRNKRRLYLAHVALSRPTELVCMAMRREDVSDIDIEKLISKGWNIEVI